MIMDERRNKSDLSFPEDEIKLAKKMMDQLRTTLEFLYYLMDHRGKFSFTMILFSADEHLKLENLLKKWKRETDILIEIDKINNVYVLLCQSTDEEGGQQFGEILMSNMRLLGGTTAYCVETELQTTSYSIQEVIFTMVEKYISIKKEKESNIVFFTKPREIENTENNDVTYYTDIL
ncbi:MAG: hypothetical protein OQK45_03395 [Sulfurovum sp.]|nr:hypothetical protein [Sulfurovum sp.]